MSLDKVYDTRIIGAGLSGIGAACRFKTAFPAESLAVIEARNAIGGDARFISIISRLFPVTYTKLLEKYQGENVILGNRG